MQHATRQVLRMDLQVDGRHHCKWQKQAANNGTTGKPTDGVRTVVFEENGAPGWQEGLNITTCGAWACANVLGFQRVPGPHGRSQVQFVGQADCFQPTIRTTHQAATPD